MVVDSNEVDEEGGPTHHGWDQEGPNEHLLNPSSACVIKKERQPHFLLREYKRQMDFYYNVAPT